MSSHLPTLIDLLSRRTPNRVDDISRTHAAVALLLAPDPDRLLLIRRAERDGDPWSGHLALPGGRRHQDDQDLLATAIRETREETGVHLERGWCRAVLDDLAPRTVASILVRPFVFFLDHAAEPGTSDEVVQATWIELSSLAKEGVYATQSIDVNGTSRNVDGYQLPDGFLWGMTERILTPVLNDWQRLRRSVGAGTP